MSPTTAIGWSFVVCALLTGCECGSPADPVPRLDASPEPLDAPPEPGDAGRDASFDAHVPPGSPLARALELLCDAHAYTRCTAPWTCGCDYHDALPFIPDRPASMENCVATERALCDLDLVNQLRSAFAAGWTLVPDAARDCIAARRRSVDWCLPTLEGDTLPGSCRDAIIGVAAVGEACDGPGIRCGGGDGVCTDGLCAALPATEGAACSTLCARGLRCIVSECRAPVGPGGACGDHEDCAGAELCIGGRCGPPAASGGACESTSGCATGLVCASGTCTPPPATCERRDVCGAASFCGTFPPGVCRALGATGAPCLENDWCAAPLVCVEEERFGPRHCAPRPRLGEPCYRDCEGDLRCALTDETHATCQPPRRLGDPCGRDSFPACGPYMACVDGSCALRPGVDEPCETEPTCDDGLVCVLVSGGRRCRPVIPDGGACTTHDECVDRPCLAGACTPPTLPARGEACRFAGPPCEPGSDCLWAGDGFRCLPAGTVDQPCHHACAADARCDVVTRCIPDICRQLFPLNYPTR